MVGFKKVKVLLVEDDLLQMMRDALDIAGAGGFEVEVAETGTEAVRKASIFQPDIILMDLRIPVMDGIQAIREIRKFMPKVPILAMTAFPAERRKQDAIEAGATLYVEKPFDIEWLITHIKNITGG